MCMRDVCHVLVHVYEGREGTHPRFPFPPPPGSVAQVLNHWKSTRLEHSIERSCAHRYT
nr:MAG TPA: hypothetical protein [Caudoviricetes sp.]